MKHNWTELAEEAAVIAADHDEDWHNLAMRRAAVAQAVALASIAESLATIAALLNDSTSEAEGFRYLRTHDIRSLLDED